MNKWYKVFGSVIPLLVSILYLFVVILISFLLCPGIRKRSKVPGVMITQFMEDLPEGMSTPDFTRKPIALTIQEGNKFKSLSEQTKWLGLALNKHCGNKGEINFHCNIFLVCALVGHLYRTALWEFH